MQLEGLGRELGERSEDVGKSLFGFLRREERGCGDRRDWGESSEGETGVLDGEGVSFSELRESGQGPKSPAWSQRG